MEIIFCYAATIGDYFTFLRQPVQISDNESITVNKSILQDKFPTDQQTLWFNTYLSALDITARHQHWLYEIHQARYRINIAPQKTISQLEKALVASTHQPTALPSKLFAYNDYNFILSDASYYNNSASYAKNSPVAVVPEIPLTQHRDQSKQPVYGYVEGDVIVGYLTNNYGNWFNQSLKSYTQMDKQNGFALQLAHDYEFHEEGNYAVGNLLHIFNDDWYTDMGTGASNKSFFVPQYYVGATAFHKMASRRQLVGYLGIHAYWWRPVYKTQDLNPGFIYYFEKSWILEMGGIVNRSNPGEVYSAAVYVSITQGRDKEHLLTLRGGFGKEAYLPLGPGIPGVVGYTSNIVTGTWRQWWGTNYGTNLIGEFYNNPYYNRYGITLGLFVDFSI